MNATNERQTIAGLGFPTSPLPSAKARQLLAQALAAELGDGWAPPGEVQVTGVVAELPFARTLRLAELTLTRNGSALPDLFVLESDDQVFLLNGDSAPIYAANARGGTEVTEATVIGYLRYFTWFLRGEQGPFTPIEALAPGAAEVDEEAAADIAAHARPLAVTGRGDDGSFLVAGCVHYDGALFTASFAVASEGEVRMVDDEPLEREVPEGVVSVPPTLYPAAHFAAHFGGDASRALVELLLERALASDGAKALLARSPAGPAGALERFAELVVGTPAVIAVESRALPSVEETLVEIIRARSRQGRELRVIRTLEAASQARGSSRGPSLYVLNGSAAREPGELEREVRAMGSGELSTLIGCRRIAALPDALRDLVELRLSLPAIDGDLFEAWFQRVIGAPPPRDWRQSEIGWISEVRSRDFTLPRKLGLPAAEALAWVRGRARERLSGRDVPGGLDLHELHGMDEARRFGEDLAIDVEHAKRGLISWRECDGGVILAGPPGTGKTTAARAIARACGLHFVHASAARWQAAGAMPEHLRAMSATFEWAIQNAPALIFIDELDGFGDRAAFSGHNASYNTQILNALLELVQGMDPEAPVIIMGATNHPENVDPALRRAGRLDRVIDIPAPSVATLARIFQHYLAASRRPLAADIDVSALAALAAGATGADIQLLVRGALRRARRAGEPVLHRHLVDEITGKPRDGQTVAALTETEARTAAIHEAGHALVSILNGQRLSLLSIAPRSNGSLGLAARQPSEERVRSRREYLDTLEVLLAGRAAEELAFGPEGVTGGASRDLETANELAGRMVTRLGLGVDHPLLWTEAPTSGQQKEIHQLLQESYTAALGKLRGRLPTLQRLAGSLELRRELSGEDAMAIVAASESLHASAAGCLPH
jgi:DNA polymerase III delta prime subunit